MARPPIHPGEILADELAELGISPTEPACQLAVPPSRISQLINGRRNITGDTALRLGHWFDMSGQFWLNLQGAHHIRLAQEKGGGDWWVAEAGGVRHFAFQSRACHSRH